MANSFTTLNPGSGGDNVDAETVDYSPEAVAARKRARQQIAGAGKDEIARVQDSAPTGTEQALVVRPIPSGTQNVAVQGTVPVSAAAALPVSGTVTVQDGGSSVSVDDNGGSLSVDDGAGSLTVDDGGGSLTVDGTVSIGNTVTVTPSGTVTVGGTVAVTQSTPAAITAPWVVKLSDGTQALGTSGNPVKVDPSGTTAQPVSGTVTAVVSPNPLPVTFSGSGLAQESTLASLLTELQGKADLADTQPVRVTSLPLSTTSTTTTIDASTTSSQIAASDSTRLSLRIANESTSRNVYVLEGTGTASATNYTYRVEPRQSVEIHFTGALQAVWDAGNPAKALVTVRR